MYFNPVYIRPAANHMHNYSSLCLDDYAQLHHLLQQAQFEKEAAMYEEQQRRRIQRALFNLEVLTELHRRREQEERAIRAYYERKERERQEWLRRQQYLAALQEDFFNHRPTTYSKYHEDPFAHQQMRFATVPQDYEEDDEEEEDRSEQLADLVKLIFGAQSEQAKHENEPENEPEDEEDEDEDENEDFEYEEHEEKERASILKPSDAPTNDDYMDIQETHQEEQENIETPMDNAMVDMDESMDEDLPSLVEHPTEDIKSLVNELLETPENNEVSVFPEENPVKLAKYEALGRIEQELKDIRQKHEEHILHNTLDFPVSDGRLSSPDSLVATTANNRQFLGYEDEIMKILLKLDTIESDGDEDIRIERKNLVKQAEMMLETLDEYRQREWERVSSGSSSEDEFIDIEPLL
ncbi:hypothetical protein G6F46_010247 [Rhizopus delemar]|uniref:BAG domain-containing protein n=3 Tax=Rhizopus TaxID=4842 RepID=I1C115_RHIO9|nr:hypothetical protein RO3G_06850 [Rhizopus delemar RA 99-880]KAG1451148.1 hypothetical protein G6F55_009324 [Rhizopus delemar]KAG1537548.1 hypothetical protein G6F51_010304 [Rhizopus arrhizus]KAG1493352.1 hypothetical protein G6F54_008640 [Rhizopus delemar]KAG1507395.1 hypothetical protein G6F53_008980 [Rhizopus delemar]|eukprot:EIE82145.1 hypothetical protein RO3G_06850 [Rhizopus delemar RA 99-880]